MNRVYRLVWNEARGCYVAAPEHARAHGKRAAGQALVLAALLAAGLVQAQLPTGGRIVAGSGHIAQTDTALTVTQTSDRLAAHWQSFSIGPGHSVQFVQPNTDAIALNRVIGHDVSVIQGALKANGQVFLVNPNGILFTQSAQVDVGG